MKKIARFLLIAAVGFVVASCASSKCCKKNQCGEAADLSKSSYTAIVISDTHYDKRKYDANSNVPSYWVGELERNYSMWDNGEDSISYKMLEQIAQVKDDTTAFILHAGDLIHGDYDSPETTAAVTADAIADITGITGLPMYMTFDNHDSCRYMGEDDPGRYPTYGAPQDNDSRDGKPVGPTTAQRATHEQAFLNVARQYEAENLAPDRMQEPLFMTKLYNKDLYIFTRGTQAGIQYLADELARYPKEDVRYTFVVIHLAPMLGKNYGDSKPWQVDSFSYYLDDPRELVVRDAELRDKVMAELAAREAIVLTGHKHYWEKIDAQFPTGVIHQLMVNSNKVAYNWMECKSFEDFAIHTEQEGKKSTLDVCGAEKVLDYRLFSDRGFLKMFVSDDGVYGEVYSCEKDGQMTEIIKLR